MQIKGYIDIDIYTYREREREGSERERERERKMRLMKPTHDSLLLRVLCLRTHQTVFNKENSHHQLIGSKWESTLVGSKKTKINNGKKIYIYVYFFVFFFVWFVSKLQT